MTDETKAFLISALVWAFGLLYLAALFNYYGG